MTGIIERVVQLSADYNMTATILMMTYLTKYQQKEDLAVKKQIEIQSSIYVKQSYREEMQHRVVDVMSRYLQMHK